MGRLLERNEVERLLRKLSQRLTEVGVIGTISLVGGAALGLHYFDRYATADIDATLPNANAVNRIIAEIATEEDLSSDWINDAAVAFIPFTADDPWINLFREGTILVRVASAELLLTMKVRANRGPRDWDDIIELLRICSIQNVMEVEALYEHFHAQEVLSEETKRAIVELLDSKRGQESES